MVADDNVEFEGRQSRSALEVAGANSVDRRCGRFSGCVGGNKTKSC